MAFTVETRTVRAGDRAGMAYTLADGAGARIEVWPSHGFNCLRWQVRRHDGGWGDLLYTAPDWDANPVPTRSGHPVLFPFPNRLADGRLPFAGREYQLPRNETSGTHAIHGFTPRNPWRVIGTGDGWIAGEFRLSVDVPDALRHWPADAGIRLTYRLTRTALRVEAEVQNHGPGAMPFGLGYHPYFRLPDVATADVSEYRIESPATELWETQGNIPTGLRLPVSGDTDFRPGRAVGSQSLDHLFTAIDRREPDSDGLACVAKLSHPASTGRLAVWADDSFRELLLFTPPHRQAVAIEPYTCATDAAHLTIRGHDAGWRTLPPGGSYSGAVEYRWEPKPMR